MVRKSNSTKSRLLILEAAAELLHQHGYKGFRVDDVVDKTGLTKGALYHHFASKQFLAYSVIDEIFRRVFLENIQSLLNKEGEPLDVITSLFEFFGENFDENYFEIGCSLINLGHEMSLEDEGFRTRVNKVFRAWIDLLSELIKKGIAGGSIKPDTEAEKVARFLVSAFQGIQCNSKYEKDLSHFQDNPKYLHAIIRGIGV